ncbi:hypothetical protein HF521_006350 [Silurus meridionalis]|uniref:SCAN box domain-containing protein n=1 Tax=Silurus meridionalis TaxID=175797 RepID=A0A8T0AW25_SILME|nr:hypothetical protein HF521_006350 [Silurus meridionalis]
MEHTYLAELYEQYVCNLLESLRDQRRALLALILAKTEQQQRLQNFMSELHRQRFLSLTLTEADDPFTFAKLLQIACEGWLLPQDPEAKRNVELLVMEQFLTGLPDQTDDWIRCQQPATLVKAAH